MFTSGMASAEYGKATLLAVNVHTVGSRLGLGDDELDGVRSSGANAHHPLLPYLPVYPEYNIIIASIAAGIDHIS